MHTSVLSSFRWRDAAHAVWRVVDTGLTAIGESWFDTMRVRCGPPRHDGDPGHEDADEELRLMIALACVGFH